MNQKSKDQFAAFACYFSLLSVLFFFSWLILDITKNSFSNISLEFLYLNPENMGRMGGIGSVIVSTVLILLISLLMTLPIGLTCALFLSDWGKEKSLLRSILRQILEVLSGVPSIVFGLFGSAFFCVYLKLGYSILAGGLTLACMILPLFIRIVEEGLKAIPEELKTASIALNFSKFGRVIHLLLPIALPSIAIATILSVGRALSETAALLFTSGYAMRTPESVFDSGRTLSVHIYDLAMNVPGGEIAAYKTAFVLILILLIINSATNVIASSLLKRKLGNLHI